ncbi:hypothetical protein IV203_016440 [Nitzschia inconspicua]|uniref:Uncharacterized protein n=1 Tax=Nitzschia inconspicua TaxID=303405 RepID=A0A9K3KQ22_9STRA|nr:hypothetical protein IV203_016440 [Nitzschia inconspicua]
MYALEKKGPYSWKWSCINSKSDDGSSTKSTVEFYYPPEGMSSLSQAMMKEGSFKVEQDVWVSPSSGVRFLSQQKNNDPYSQNSPSKWQVRAQGRVLGEYSHLVIAHNGKCADRLMSQTPAKDVHQLLRVNFSDRVPANGGQKMTLNSLYSVTIALKSASPLSRALPDSFLCGFVQGHPKLSVVSCQTQKYPPMSYGNANDETIEVWNILSTATFAKQHKAPQEFLAEEVVANVTQQLVEALEEIVVSNIDNSPLLDQVVDSRVQLWGAAVPMNVWNAEGSKGGFVWDPRFQVGVCGDWLVEPSIAGAWTSGRCIGHHLKEIRQARHNQNDQSVGLDGRFEASSGVRRLGIASLDGPMNNSKENDTRLKGFNTSPGSRNRANNKHQGESGSIRPGNRVPQQKKGRKPVATIDSSNG